MIQTDWRNWEHNGNEYTTRVRYGFDLAFALKTKQEPYFSITGDTERFYRGRWREDSCGQIREDIARAFPGLVPLFKWHLVSVNSGPMHYLANATYWFNQGVMHGWDKPIKGGTITPREAFESTVIYGACADDGGFNYAVKDPEEVKYWLGFRMAELMKRFRDDMTSFGIDIPIVE